MRPPCNFGHGPVSWDSSDPNAEIDDVEEIKR